MAKIAVKIGRCQMRLFEEIEFAIQHKVAESKWGMCHFIDIDVTGSQNGDGCASPLLRSRSNFLPKKPEF